MGQGICAAVTEDVALGLSLSGISDLFIHDRKPDEKILREWYMKKVASGAKVMILSPVAGEVLSRELFNRRITGDLLPITVIIPGEGEDRRAADLIKRAIGMDPNKGDNE